MTNPTAVPCNAAQLHRFGDLSSEHGPHEWIVQPGMPAVRCPGTAAASAGQAPATDHTHGLTVQQADALWDAVAIPGPRQPAYTEQHERVCRTVAGLLGEVAPATDQTALRDRIADALDNARHTHPCPVTGSTYWTGCYHPDGTSASCHTDRRTDAVLAVLPVPAVQAEAVLRVVEAALGDTLVPAAREEALAGIVAVLPESAPTDEVERLRLQNARLRHELEVMYGGAFDSLPAHWRHSAETVTSDDTPPAATEESR
jgi:hypothetical protein